MQDHFLPYVMRGKLKLLLEGDDNQESLLQFVDRSVKLPERKALLEVDLWKYYHSIDVAQLFFSKYKII